MDILKILNPCLTDLSFFLLHTVNRTIQTQLLDYQGFSLCHLHEVIFSELSMYQQDYPQTTFKLL